MINDGVKVKKQQCLYPLDILHVSHLDAHECGDFLITAYELRNQCSFCDCEGSHPLYSILAATGQSRPGKRYHECI